MKHKITIIFSNYDDIKNPYYAGGGAHAVHQVAKRLTKAYRVIVLTGKYPGSKNERIDNVFYRRIGTTRFGPQIGQIAYSLALPITVMRSEFAVWIESFTPPFSTGCLQLFTKKPIIGLVHMLASEDMQRKYKLPFSLIERLGLKTYHDVIVLTKESQTDIKKSARKVRTHIIPNGVSIIKRSYSTKKNPYILFLGRIDINQKGIDLLLQAYKRMSKKTRCHLVIAGGGERAEEEKLNELISSLKLEKNVVLTGKVGQSEKEKLIGNAVCVVAPSRFETFSLVALEALSAGVPLITFAIKGLNWIPETAAVKVKQFDTAKLSGYLLKADKNPEFFTTRLKNGKHLIASQSWDAVTKKYAQLITEVIK